MHVEYIKINSTLLSFSFLPPTHHKTSFNTDYGNNPCERTIHKAAHVITRVNTLIQEEVPDPTTLLCSEALSSLFTQNERPAECKELRVREREGERDSVNVCGRGTEDVRQQRSGDGFSKRGKDRSWNAKTGKNEGG